MKLIFLLLVSLCSFLNYIQIKVILSLFRLDGLLKLNRCNICYTWGNICYSVECLIDACLIAQLCSSPWMVACQVLLSLLKKLASPNIGDSLLQTSCFLFHIHLAFITFSSSLLSPQIKTHTRL